MKLVRVKISDLKFDPRNPRLHGDRAIGAMKQSLQRFGQQKPIVVREKDNMILAGNGLTRAAQELGWDELDAVINTLEDKDALAYGITDNRAAELSAWDREVLGGVMRDLDDVDMLQLGWTESEFSALTQIEMPEFSIDDPEPDPQGIPTGTIALATEVANRPPVGHVRMVQLFLDAKSISQFEADVAELQKFYGKSTVTDAIVEAVKREAARCPADTHPE